MLIDGHQFTVVSVPLRDVYVHGLLRDHERAENVQIQGSTHPLDIVDGNLLVDPCLAEPHHGPMIRSLQMKTQPTIERAYGAPQFPNGFPKCVSVHRRTTSCLRLRVGGTQAANPALRHARSKAFPSGLLQNKLLNAARLCG